MQASGRANGQKCPDLRQSRMWADVARNGTDSWTIELANDWHEDCLKKIAVGDKKT